MSDRSQSDAEVNDNDVEEFMHDKEDDNDDRYEISADAWGKKKIAFYGGLADKERGGWDDEEDENLEFEEQDAIERQKKIDADVDKVDLAALLGSDDESDHKDKEEEPVKIVPKQVAMQSKSVDYFLKHSPTLDALLSEYNKRLKSFKTQKPILEGILQAMKDVAENDFIKKLKLVLATYNQYMSSLMFFFYLKGATSEAKFKSTENHPVLDDIMNLHPTVSKVDLFLKKNMQKLERVYEKLKENPDYASKILSVMAEPPKKKVRAISSVFDEEAEEDMEMGRYKAEDEFGKRKITREMQKNRGLTPSTKKGLGHSRVRKRSQYKKALYRQRANVPDVRKETTKYDGEKRGIRVTTVRSIKLKA
uniref:Sas10 C-terminal domain-containing protein n=1 Tax=Panagrolaimus sp. JU765 TaxID=591449 RepID=A0AC34Q3Z5_9BILA